MNRSLHHLVFAVGLLAIAWIGTGYFPAHPLALALVVLIGAFFLAGALELHRFHQATTGLAAQLAATTEPPGALAPWIASLHPSLHPAVRLRIEGERVALPGPALTPYLTGLLVLLGMLGTFLGMVVTLKGTGLALENATDVDTIRASLVAPVKGLGLAFGTSVAGVAASAALGLMSALVRRERQRAGQQLDARIATVLRGFSPAHQREESLRLQRAQAEAVPALVAQVQGLVEHLQRHSEALHDRLSHGQAQFHEQAQHAYTALAESVDRSLKASLGESARLAGAAIEPAVQATMAGLAREAAGLREAVHTAVQQQLDGVGARLDATTRTLAERWQAALADQQRHGEAMTQGLHASLDQFTQTFAQRAATLVDGVAARLDDSARRWADSAGHVLAQQQHAHEALAQEWRDASAASLAGIEQHAAALLRQWADAQAAGDTASAAHEQARMAAFHQGLSTMAETLREQAQRDSAELAERQQQICRTLELTAESITAQTEARARATLDEIGRLVDAASAAPRAAADVIGELRGVMSDSLARDNAALDERQRQICATLEQTAQAIHMQTEAQARALLGEVARLVDAASAAPRAAADVIGELRGLLSERLASDSAALDERQQRICSTLEQTARAITAQTEAQSRATLGEIARLMEAASAAPRAAADVIGELRSALSDSLVRDNAALDERNRLMATLGGLLDAVNHASTEQRAAIDALVQATTGVLDRAGARFAEAVDAEAQALHAVTAQVTSSAAEMGSLGEGFGVAVQLFSGATEQLMAQLQRIEAALGQSMARSDEQLAYYVAQAREIVDLTLGSQKQIVEDLQQLAVARAAPTAAPELASP